MSESYFQSRLRQENGLKKETDLKNETVTINEPLGVPGFSWWDYPLSGATYAKYFSDESSQTVHALTLFGGLLRHQALNVFGAALIMCHEFGHGFAGVPFLKSGEGSVEAQADYFAAKECTIPLIDHLRANDVFVSVKAASWCEENEHFLQLQQISKERCHIALQSIDSMFNSIGIETHNLRIDLNSASIVEKLNRNEGFYPDDQCRLTGLLRGFFGLSRAKCWFPKN